jgi:hypothetical protein
MNAPELAVAVLVAINLLAVMLLRASRIRRDWGARRPVGDDPGPSDPPGLN